MRELSLATKIVLPHGFSFHLYKGIHHFDYLVFSWIYHLFPVLYIKRERESNCLRARGINMASFIMATEARSP
jgi:hypothetical protein